MIDPYATHLPVITAAAHWAAQFDLPTLELGCGDYSTPLLRGLSTELHIVSSDPEWSGRYEHMADKFTLLPSKESWQSTWKPDQNYGMILLDNEEMVINRIKHIPMLLNYCNILVMHDWRDGLPIDVGNLVDHWGIYKKWLPWTMWASHDDPNLNLPVDVEAQYK